MKRVETIADGMERRSDNFLLLRFLAASMVIYGHAPAVTGQESPPDLFVWLNWGEYSGDIALDFFFVISGFLVTGSFLRRQHVADFLWARILRIFPALVVCLTISAFVIAPFFTRVPRSAYLADPATSSYVLTNLKMQAIAWNLPGVFAGNPHLSIVNASLWTLPAEVRMYLWVAALGLVGVVSRTWFFNIVVVGVMLYGWLRPDFIPLVPIAAYVRLAALFAVGGLCYVNRASLPNHLAVVFLFAGLAWLYRDTRFYPYLFALSEASFVFWFAYRTRWYGFNRLGDYSYGLYLWGFFAQQMIAALANDLSSIANALFGWCLALLFAVFSWHLIEKPALKFKGIPGSLWQRSRSVVRKLTSNTTV